jgi:antitoxin component YwqK of YwqJK toxin-antitoxin module
MKMKQNEEVKVEYWDNGNKKSEEDYKNGKKHGLTTHYYESGHIEFESVYVNGKPIGVQTQYHDDPDGYSTVDGKSLEHHFTENHIRHGMYTTWDNNGDIIDQYRYVNGEIVETYWDDCKEVLKVGDEMELRKLDFE